MKVFTGLHSFLEALGKNPLGAPSGYWLNLALCRSSEAPVFLLAVSQGPVFVLEAAATFLMFSSKGGLSFSLTCSCAASLWLQQEKFSALKAPPGGSVNPGWSPCLFVKVLDLDYICIAESFLPHILGWIVSSPISQIHVHLDPQKVTLFGNNFFADGIR